jgi:hypothetical protein
MKISGTGSVVTVAQEAAVPLVVKYFPALLVCDGKALTVVHSTPSA